jgi:hypothetical protein
MKFVTIKRRWLRRILMVAFGWPFVVQYLWLGLSAMYFEFKGCWNYQHEEKPHE